MLTRLSCLPTFAALRHRDFRVFWLAFVVSAAGTWMQIVALSLLVLKLSHGSALALGCVSLSQASAFFVFALVGGSFADRVDRTRLLIVTQTALMRHCQLGACASKRVVVSATFSVGLAVQAGHIVPGYKSDFPHGSIANS